MIEFKWNANKSKENLKKHSVSFEEAKTVFFDEKARLIADSEHSYDEERYILLGISIKFRFLIVVHTYKEKDNIIRIISSRKANKKEIKQYKRLKS